MTFLNTRENIKYDIFIKAYNGFWHVKINNQYHYFPYSLCELDEKSKVILCPEWLIIEKGLEAYIDK